MGARLHHAFQVSYNDGATTQREDEDYSKNLRLYVRWRTEPPGCEGDNCRNDQWFQVLAFQLQEALSFDVGNHLRREVGGVIQSNP